MAGSVVRFRVEAAEKEEMENEAKKLGLTLSAFLRLLFRYRQAEDKNALIGAVLKKSGTELR